jgi:hypothetical protein
MRKANTSGREAVKMGDRGQVNIEGVWLYTHWGATDLPMTVHDAIIKKWRWSDPEYLARIIFEEMIKGDEGGETGYGIGSSMHGDVGRVVYVNCTTQKIKIVDNGEKIRWEGSFEEFADDTHIEDCNDDTEDDE